MSTPSGQITANPEVVVIPAGSSSGSTSSSWSTRNSAAAQVAVTAAGGAEQRCGDAASFQNSVAPWIGSSTFTFRLYGDRTRTLLLDSVVVTGVLPPSYRVLPAAWGWAPTSAPARTSARCIDMPKLSSNRTESSCDAHRALSFITLH
jgi:hypothetical protein